jgi:hypothetical protein
MREQRMKATEAAIQLAKANGDKIVIEDSLAIMEYAMRYFFTEAFEAKPDDKETIKTAIMDAVSIAAQVESAHGARRRDLAADHGRAAPEDHGNLPAAHDAG